MSPWSTRGRHKGISPFGRPPYTQWFERSAHMVATQIPAMLRKTETRAIHLIRSLYDAAEGRPNQWHSLRDLDMPQATESVRYATSRGWIRVEGGNNLCLTDAGWRLTELL